jgi:hypothetical protein
MRHAETAAWFVNGETFSKWKWSEQGSLLWIQGKGGFAAHPMLPLRLMFFLSFLSRRRKERPLVCELFYISVPRTYGVGQLHNHPRHQHHAGVLPCSPHVFLLRF